MVFATDRKDGNSLIVSRSTYFVRLLHGRAPVLPRQAEQNIWFGMIFVELAYCRNEIFGAPRTLG